jgi:hypothetical protein
MLYFIIQPSISIYIFEYEKIGLTHISFYGVSLFAIRMINFERQNCHKLYQLQERKTSYVSDDLSL